MGARTAELVPELNAALAELEGLIYSEDFCTEGGLSLDDIDLWSRLRSVTLIGKKIAPILEEPDSGFVMGESMDIVKKFDEDPAFGPQIFGPASGREDIKAWMKGVKDLLRLLHRPRYMQANLPEFQQKDSRDYFIGGHPVPPFDKPEWKAADFPAAKKEAEYAAAMARTAELVPELSA